MLGGATLAWLALPTDSVAADWGKLVMPGPLVSAHAKWEGECSACHKAFDTSAQRALCLACHEEVAGDLAATDPDRRGFHGRNALARTGECRSCHTDHQGREADIRGLSEATFDHAETDHPLHGAHRGLACAQCHLPEVARRDAPSDCIACHREDDAHRGKLSEQCGDCHTEASWRETRFDHDRTRYPLVGAHATASCDGCHAGERYAETPRECVACHSIDDAHAGRFGERCGDCHDPTSWKKEGFDHERKSGFPLVGAHGRASCNTCHREAPGKRKLPESCSGCHATQDVHSGRFGAECGSCHRPERWSVVDFDHGRRTEFALHGAHARTPCTSCHSGPMETTGKKRDHRCIACHDRDDVHRGELGTDCGDCHGEESFVENVAFDHDLTKFPLLGLHAIASCEACHADHTFRQADAQCVSCHRADDVHRETLGSSCATCHNPNGWSVWRFDHGRQTSFALEGAHESLKCAACHRQPMNAASRMSTSCFSCHASDDAHRGGFGRGCDGCHGVEAWKPAKLGRMGGTRR
jgi:hypothetical protein